jgi:hypothetical protein
MTLGPALTLANFGVPQSVTTHLVKGESGGTPPIIKVKWEMLNEVEADPGIGEEGNDDDPAPGAQFLAPGQWEGRLKYTVCAIATDPNGIEDIEGVYAEIFYPEDRAYREDPQNPDEPGKPDTEYPGVGACGAFIEQNTLIRLSKEAGYELFCEEVRNNNPDLPIFSEGYNYEEICDPDGELLKETAYVWCADKELIFEDPAGLYKVIVYAQDQAGNFSNRLENHFKYLEVTGFEKDFDSVDYGEVSAVSKMKKIAGNLEWGDGIPTIRNIGNTRLKMKVAQDDMGFGMSSGEWNIEFDARVGTDEADWEFYDPFGYKGEIPTYPGDFVELEDTLELSEIEEMDFSVHIKKWQQETEYTGTMWLAANRTGFRECPEE